MTSPVRRSPRGGRRYRTLVITGSRAEFGLLRPVMAAIKKHRKLELLACVAGEHLLAPAFTWKEVAREFRIDARVPMQRSRDRGRLDHAAACARGMTGFAAAYKRIKPDWVVVLGDRIEAFAAASAASIGGIAVCHIHGGDRAEGIADEAMRHAITKLSHLHCAATKASARRIVAMGEAPKAVVVTGSPAIDGLRHIKPMGDADALRLGDPRAVLLLHSSGMPASRESFLVRAILSELGWCGQEPTLVLSPNSDPGSETIRKEIESWKQKTARWCTPAALSSSGRDTPAFVFRDHLPRAEFIALLKRIAQAPPDGPSKARGFLIGNSSAGLVEAGAIGLRCVNIGDRQAGRERGKNVCDLAFSPTNMWATGPLEGAILAATFDPSPSLLHPYGDGRAGPRIAALLAKTDPRDPALLRKRNSY